LPIIDVLCRRPHPRQRRHLSCRDSGSLTGIIRVILRHTFIPHNNTRLTHLCGPADIHLRTIETALSVGIAHRHEQFKVDGPKAKATQAMELLQALYEMADHPIPEDHLQLMLAGDTELLEAPDDAIVLNTRRADLRGRTTALATAR
jgi:phosphate starvation-inducible PhoH-like protein